MSQPQDQRASRPAQAPDQADGPTIPAGQEALVRRMVAPALPPGWTFLQASILPVEVRARYRWEGPPALLAEPLLAELRLAHSSATSEGLLLGCFRLRLLSPRAEASLAPLREALLASVRAEEPAFVWERPVVPLPAVHGTTRWTPTPAEPGPPDPGPAANPEAPVEDPSALRVRRMWQLGRYREALVLLDDAIARSPEDPSLHATAAVLRGELHDTGRAAEHARAVVDRAQDSPGLLLQAATVLLSLGHEDEARRAADRVLSAAEAPSTALLLDVASLHRDAGHYASADALYARVLSLDPSSAEARIAAGTLCAWRGETSAALAHAEAVLASLPDSAPALCLRASARMLSGALPLALEDLDRATALDPGDPVAAVWRGEALLRLGRRDEALAETRRGGERSDDISNHVAAQLLISLAQLRGGDFPGLPEYVLRPALATLWKDSAATAPLLPPGELPEDPDPTALEALFEGALVRLRGNRSPVATYVRQDGSLVRLAVPSSPRVASKRALWRFVATGSLDEALAELDRVHALVPRAAEPYNYRGELFLYLGDASAARREFERAITLYGRSRWAYIGLAGAAVIEGRYEEALDHLAEGIVQAGAPGPTTFVYRGEALRCLGRSEEARADLMTSVRRNPGRIGAWVNLALLDASEGDLGAVRATFALLRRRAPGFVSDALEALSLDPSTDLDPDGLVRLLEQMLTMLRGNRASSCVTYFTRDGRLRAVPPSSDAEP